MLFVLLFLYVFYYLFCSAKTYFIIYDFDCHAACRLVAMLAGTDSIRDVIVPKSTLRNDLVDAPSGIPAHSLTRTI
jgi:hypothetical protein